jgi:hypothetical protein
MCTVLFLRTVGANAKAKGVSLSRLVCCVLRQRYLVEAVMALALRGRARTRVRSTTKKGRCVLNESDVKYDVEMMQAKTGLYPALDLEMTIIWAQLAYRILTSLHTREWYKRCMLVHSTHMVV